jgi:hypothetical protein
VFSFLSYLLYKQNNGCVFQYSVAFNVQLFDVQYFSTLGLIMFIRLTFNHFMFNW